MSLRRIVVVLAAVVLVGTLVWAICAPKRETNPFIRLPDGGMTRLVAVTYGDSNTWFTGRSYQKFLYRLLPAKFKSWSGAKVVNMGGIGGMSSNGPEFWMEEVRQAPVRGPQPEPVIASLDEFGTEVFNQALGRNWAALSDLDSIAKYHMEPYGPLGRIVGMVFYDPADRSNRLGTFLIPGTKPSAAGPASTTALAEVNEAGLRFQLMSLVTGFANAETKPNYISTNGATFTQALFRLREDERPLLDWMPVGIEATDRNGNSVHSRITLIGKRDGDLAYNFEGTLNPAEGPWKLRVQFRQSFYGTNGWGPAHYGEFSVMPVWYRTNAVGGK